MSKTLWLRCEEKAGEQRSPLLPGQVRELLDLGIEVVVEEDPGKIFSPEEFSSLGAKIVPASSWKSAPAHAVILGLKELSEDNFPLKHTHIHFAHCFKSQKGAKQFLNRFQENGKLYDLEFLKYESGKRIAAFGYWAGFIGAAIALEAFHQLENQGSLKDFHCQAFTSKENYLKHLKDKGILRPSAFVMGALGRCGRGARDLFKAFDLAVTEWDVEETKKKSGPYPEILNHDIFLNCVFLNKSTPPFLTKECLQQPHQLRIISDVSCDPSSPNNPLPLYNQVTTLQKPFIQIHEQVHLQAIDHLPTLLPKESSEEFCADLFPHLKNFLLEKDPEGVWRRALEAFHAAC